MMIKTYSTIPKQETAVLVALVNHRQSAEQTREYLDELAFLAMECERLGANWIGPLLLGTCCARLGDAPSDRLIDFYGIYLQDLIYFGCQNHGYFHPEV